ncbi:MAG: amino acid adenylation domain-containing protein, partial [Candidatus Aminicenantes bacterium]
MKSKSGKKLKSLSLFNLEKLEVTGNRAKPGNDFIEFDKEEINQSIGDCFRKRANRNREKIAVRTGDKSITYGFLSDYALLVAHHLLKEYDDRTRLTQEERTRYQRQLMLHGWGIESQEKLKGAVVFAAGAGGSGSPLLQQLALMGIGTIIVCDHDTVELSNLNRQVLHDESRIGMNKALSAKITLERINPNVNVIAHPVKVTRENVFELVGDARIIFDNVDDLEAKFILSQCAVIKQIPHILSSMIDLNAYAVVLHSPYTPCFHCLYDRDILEEIETIKTHSRNYQKSSNPVVSSSLFLSTGFAVTEAIKILLNFDQPAYNKYILFNQRGTHNVAASEGYQRLTYPFTSHFKSICQDQGVDWDRGWKGALVEELQISPDPNCPVCGPNRQENLWNLPEHQPQESQPSVHHRTRKQSRQNQSHWQAVALLFAHGVEMIIGLMGTVMSGKTYVPLDPDYPRERLEYILEDSEARLIVTDSPHYPLADALRNQVNKNIKVIDIDKIRPGVSTLSPGPFEVSIQPDQTAYVLYTSGSTGTPKGVMQSHRNVLHFARVYTNALHIHEEDRLTLFSSYGFDAAKMDIFGALLNGAALYPFDVKQEGSLYQLPGWLQKEKITIYHSIPTVYRYFTDLLSTGMETGGAFPHLRFIVLGGEAVYKKDVETYKKYFFDECLFINGLGPTESTVTLQYFINKEWDLATEAVPVGYPVEDTEVFLLDERDQETVVNAVGEIIYKSDYLALGYLKKPGKTNAVFGVDPRTGNGRIYRSGDLGRRLDDGSIEYAGRKDFQVKIRGYRVEPGEIESKLDRIAGIKKSVVVCRQESAGENSLIAYYQTSERSEINENQLVRQLKESLPDYMIPGAFFRLQEFPLTVTGKIDRKTLADKILSQGLNLNRVRYAPPRDEVEKKLAEIWAELLGHSLQGIGIDDNFFERGGHSLKAIILVSKINQIFNVRIPLTEVFKRPSIKELSRFLPEPGGSEESTDICSPIRPVETKEYYPLSPTQRRLYILQQMEVGFTGYNMPKVVLLEGNLDKNRFEKVFQQLISRHETLRTSLAMIDEQLVQVVHREVDFEIE